MLLSFGFFVIAGPREHVPVVNLLPIDLPALEELTHLFAGLLEPGFHRINGTRRAEI